MIFRKIYTLFFLRRISFIPGIEGCSMGLERESEFKELACLMPSRELRLEEVEEPGNAKKQVLRYFTTYGAQ